MNLLKEKLYKIFIFAFAFSLPLISLAGNTNGEPCDNKSGKICNPISAYTFYGLIMMLLQGIIKIMIPVVAVAIIYCGFLFVSARGNAEKITKAKDALFYTLIGSAILLGSYALAELIASTVNSLK